MSDRISPSGRISWLDGWRGIAMYLMLFYHLCYDLAAFGWMSWESFFSLPMDIVQIFISRSFIFLSGVSCCLSRNNLKRGIWCVGAGLLVVAASYVVGSPIRFGVLQLLSACMILYGLFGKWTKKLSRKLAPWLYIALYIGTKIWTESVVIDQKWLFWLGFLYPGYSSADHFPLFPYMFLFLLGTWAGDWVKEHREHPLLQKEAPRWLTWPGARTIWVYLAHQPLLYGLCSVIYILK